LQKIDKHKGEERGERREERGERREERGERREERGERREFAIVVTLKNVYKERVIKIKSQVRCTQSTSLE
jgi:hypothetical protein